MRVLRIMTFSVLMSSVCAGSAAFAASSSSASEDVELYTSCKKQSAPDESKYSVPGYCGCMVASMDDSFEGDVAQWADKNKADKDYCQALTKK